MNEKNELNGQLTSAERMLQGALATAKKAWEEGEIMFNPREYSDVKMKLARCKNLHHSIEKELKQFEPSALSRTADVTKL